MTNLTGQDVPVAVAVGGEVTYTTDDGGSGTVSAAITMTWPAEQDGYATIPAGSSLTGNGIASFDITSQATTGDLTLSFQTFTGTYPNLGPTGTTSIKTQFLQNGAPVPAVLGSPGR